MIATVVYESDPMLLTAALAIMGAIIGVPWLAERALAKPPPIDPDVKLVGDLIEAFMSVKSTDRYSAVMTRVSAERQPVGVVALRVKRGWVKGDTLVKILEARYPDGVPAEWLANFADPSMGVDVPDLRDCLGAFVGAMAAWGLLHAPE